MCVCWRGGGGGEARPPPRPPSVVSPGKSENYKKKLEFRRIRKWKKPEEKQVILEQKYSKVLTLSSVE